MKLPRRLLKWCAVLLVVLVAGWAGYTYFYEGNLGQPEYTVIGQEGDVEFRRYTPFIIASTPMRADGDSGLRSGFRVLAKYIFGGNQPGERLAMTAPVLQQETGGESLPMTAPVLQSDADGRMAFVMPADRALDTLPKPNSDDISLTRVDWGDVAAIRFSGRGRQARFEAAEAELRSALASTARRAAGPALYAQYNSPSAFPPLRRNEVLIPLVPLTAP